MDRVGNFGNRHNNRVIRTGVPLSRQPSQYLSVTLLIGNRMNIKLRIILLALLFHLPSAFAGNCTGEQIEFSFSNISAQTAFSIVADFASLQLEIDESIKRSKPIRFDCMHWRKAASRFANEFDVKLKIYNGRMYVDD